MQRCRVHVSRHKGHLSRAHLSVLTEVITVPSVGDFFLGCKGGYGHVVGDHQGQTSNRLRCQGSGRQATSIAHSALWVVMPRHKWIESFEDLRGISVDTLMCVVLCQA